jgi:hypothetical protein
VILRKLPDWRERLDEYLHSVSTLKFDWRTHNCAGFVSQCIAAQCGHDPWAVMRARYAELESDADVHLAMAREYGTLEKMLEIELVTFGFREVSCASAGSPVITMIESGVRGAGVSMGRYTVALTEQGLTMSSYFKHANAWGWP